MELRHLRYFVAVAEELSFTRAAERLHISQPPLSTQIKALEDELGARLFERDQRRVFLTQAGQHFLLRAHEILAQAEAAKAEARRAARGEIARLTLGYTASAMFTAVLPPSIRAFRQQFSTVALTLQETTSIAQLDAIAAREMDVGVLRRPDSAPLAGIRIEAWYETPLVVAITRDHPLVRAGKPIALASLRNEPFILYPRESGIGLYWPVLRLCASAGFRPRVVQEVQQASTIIGLVAAGVGVAILPMDSACIRLAGTAYLPLQDPGAVSALHIAHRVREPDPNALAFLAVLRAGVAQYAGHMGMPSNSILERMDASA
jgi:DNA-binding transcriptional LysR family regulator